MGVVERFLAYAGDFEVTYEDDDWSRLEPHFAPDVAYTVENIYFACRIEGVKPLLTGLRRSLDGFDRRAASRKIEVTSGPEIDGDSMTVGWTVHYTFGGDVPDFDLVGESTTTVKDDLIVAMTDRYPDGFSDGAQAFLADHLPELDPSYL